MKRSGKPLGSKISSLGRGDDKNLERADSCIRFVFYKPGTFFLDNVELKEAGKPAQEIVISPVDTTPDVFDLRTPIKAAKATLSGYKFDYNGKVQKPTVTVKDGKTKLGASSYTVKYSNKNSKKAGTYKVTVTLKGNYSGNKTVSYKIVKVKNPLKIKAKKATVSFAKLKKKNQTLKVSQVIKTLKKGKGTMVYAKAKGNAKISINKKTGKITIKKGLKKGTYTVWIKVKAKGNANYQASEVFKIKTSIVVK